MKDFPLLKLPLLQSLVRMRESCVRDLDHLGGDCPYDIETVSLLRELFAAPAITAVAKTSGEAVRSVGRPKGEAALTKLKASSADTASDELKKLQVDLASLREDGKVLHDMGDRIQVIKTGVALIEKLTVLEERQFSTKRMARFQQTVVTMLDELMPAELRAEFMARLATYVGED